jgi:zinc protease
MRRAVTSGVAMALAALTVTVGARQSFPAATLTVPYTLFTLPNGLTVILHEDHSVPEVAVDMWYHVGSSRELPGRTGFAHLFEHLMFEGSGHVKKGEFDTLLETAGGSNNGSTTEDRTNYYELVPSNALDLALFLESDRMGYLLDVVTPTTVDSQRDVVKNERRQRIDNAPYGTALVRIPELIYPPDHPYHWPVVGYMDDLSAASEADVVNFFKTYYGPANASLVVAGDIDPVEARKKVEYWFRDVKPSAPVPPLSVPNVALTSVITETLTDHVPLPRLYVCWPTPALYAPGDAALDTLSGVLTGGKNSRLYKRLVYDDQVAQEVQASENSSRFGSIYIIQITARPTSDPPAQVLAHLKAVVDEELDKLRAAPPDARELERVRHGIESSFFDQMETVANVADQLNTYYTFTGNPDFFGEDLGRYEVLQPNDIQAAVVRWLPRDRRVELSVLPEADK